MGTQKRIDNTAGIIDDGESEKVDLAAIYRELASCMSQEDDKELKKILKDVKKASLKGKYTLKVKIDENVYDWLQYACLRSGKIKPELISKLEDYGFVCGSSNYEIGLMFSRHTMIISWQKK